jgi:hypothetical protein
MRMAIKNTNRGELKWKVISILSLLCTLTPLTFFSLWIYVYNQGQNQMERVAAFKDFFPRFLHGRWDIVYLGMICCLLAIILSGWSINRLNTSWRIFNVIIIILSSCLAILFGIGLL